MKEFPPFRPDGENECLWRGEERIPLTPKAFAVLNYLVDRNGKLVTQKELLDDLWNGTFVQPEVLKTYILDIRSTLGDDAKNPTFIETIPRRGYRFIANVRDGEKPAAEAAVADGVPRQDRPDRIKWLLWAAAGILVLGGLAGFGFRRPGNAASSQQVIRFLIPQGFSTFGRIAISPNGKRLAIWDPIGEHQQGGKLWVRDLDSPDARMLPDTESQVPNIAPVWSPDNRYLAFNSDGKLKKADTEGGPVQVLCDVPFGLVVGLMWTPDDRIVFGTATGLWQVPGSGGNRTPVTVPDQSRQDWAHIFPTLLPDGKHFLYVRISHKLENSGVYAGSLDVKPEQQSLRLLMPRESGVVYTRSPDGVGRVLYRVGGSLLARRFDDRRLEFTGEAAMVAETSSDLSVWPGFDATGNTLAYLNPFHSHSQLIWFDREGKTTGAVQGPDPSGSFSLSPDGTRVIYSEHLDLWLLDFGDNKTTRLTFKTAGQGGSDRPIWSPDGTRIIFDAGSPDHLDVSDIHEKVLVGGDAEQVLLKTTKETQDPDSWSADGRYVLFTHMRPSLKPDLWVLSEPDKVPGDGRTSPVLSTKFSQTDGVFSPDGKWFAYVSDESGRREIYVRPFDPHPKDVSAPGGGRLVSSGGGLEIRWPGKSSELFYLTLDGKIMAVPVSTSPDFHAGPPQQVLPGPVNGWDVTADGKRLLVAAPHPDTSPPFTVVVNWQSALKN